ncbi:site-2 protease family protein [Thermococcus sp.]|uniref:site-2 protease family protein n=1 Tax=Thermococcus sp. TaxID=35749 RepID=UPI0026133F2D|nr:site-2 protease family protein [Thermococcus sp.]
MPRGIYECVNCGHREIIDSNEPLLEGACPRCGGDMILVGFETERMPSPELNKRDMVISPTPIKPTDEVEDVIKKFYRANFRGRDGNVFVFTVDETLSANFEEFLRELEEHGYWAALKKRSGEVFLYVFPAGEIKPDNPWLPWVFLISTIATTFLAGYLLSMGYIQLLDRYGIPGIRNPYLNALAFSISVMGILGTHELGHKIAAAYHGVRATMPYFIPFPSILGTLGAVIRVKSPLPTKDAAIDLGVSGPLAGFLVALPVSIIGLKLSVSVPANLIPPGQGGITFGENLLFMLIEKYMFSQSGNTVLFLHPIAIAGWVGILVTFLNLIPAAQLDGGHIARALLSEKAHRYMTIVLAFALMAMSYLWIGWMIWGLLVLMMGMAGNPGALDEVTPLSKKRILLAVIAVVLFVLSATPAPISASG